MCAIVLPHQFHDNADETASGAQVMDQFNAVKAPVETVEARLASALAPEGVAFVFRYGNVSAITEAGGNIAVTYATPFAAETIIVVATSLNAGGSPVYRCTGISRTGFTAFFNKSAEPEQFNYIAIGH